MHQPEKFQVLQAKKKREKRENEGTDFQKGDCVISRGFNLILFRWC